MRYPLLLGLATALSLTGGTLVAKTKAPPHKSVHSAKHGDAKTGAKLFAKRFPADCKSCHKFGKTGGALGPELTHVGKKMSEAKIKTVLKNPKSLNPKTIMPPTKGSDKELSDMAAFLATKK
jgi:mono/diheme cytochrome c family protein